MPQPTTTSQNTSRNSISVERGVEIIKGSVTPNVTFQVIKEGLEDKFAVIEELAKEGIYITNLELS